MTTANISSASDTRINPFILVMMVIMIAGALFGLNKFSIWIAPAIFIMSCLGMVVIGTLHTRTERKARLEIRTVNYARLSATNVVQYAPWLKENLRGHDAVIDHVTAALQQSLLLAKPGRTLGAFFLVGPTGTGKTFLGQLLAQAIYPDSQPLVLRMNQYKHADDVFTLIGPPPGSPGYEVGGTLTRPVLDNPYRVVVFDELEKCHPDLHDCLYDILDTATCREKSSGKMVDFSGCAFFATCNAGVESLRAIAQRTSDPLSSLRQSRDALVESAKFDKAFLARWSGIYLMDDLALIHVAEVACLQISRYWREYGVEVTYASPEILLEAVERNDDFRSYGVRQLGAYIQMKTNDAIALARQQGLKRVSLGLGEDGGLQVFRQE